MTALSEMKGLVCFNLCLVLDLLEASTGCLVCPNRAPLKSMMVRKEGRSKAYLKGLGGKGCE